MVSSSHLSHLILLDLFLSRRLGALRNAVTLAILSVKVLQTLHATAAQISTSISLLAYHWLSDGVRCRCIDEHLMWLLLVRSCIGCGGNGELLLLQRWLLGAESPLDHPRRIMVELLLLLL